MSRPVERFDSADLDRIIEMAWEDRTTFEAIPKAAGGFIENIDDVIAQSVLIGRDEIVSDVLDA